MKNITCHQQHTLATLWPAATVSLVAAYPTIRPVVAEMKTSFIGNDSGRGFEGWDD